MLLQPKVIVLGVLALSVGTMTTLLFRHGQARDDVDAGIANLPESAPAEVASALEPSATKFAALPAQQPARPETAQAPGPRPNLTSTPAPDPAATPDPRLLARMAEVRAALRAIPIERITGADRSRIPALLMELEPVLEKDLAVHLAREALRGQQTLSTAVESAFNRSVSFYDELPKLAALVGSGRATVVVAETARPRSVADAVFCTNRQDGQVQQALVTTLAAQWTLTFGIDPSVGTIHAGPTATSGKGSGRRPPFQGGTDPTNGPGGGNGNGTGGGNNQRGRRRRGGG